MTPDGHEVHCCIRAAGYREGCCCQHGKPLTETDTRPRNALGQLYPRPLTDEERRSTRPDGTPKQWNSFMLRWDDVPADPTPDEVPEPRPTLGGLLAKIAEAIHHLNNEPDQRRPDWMKDKP